MRAYADRGVSLQGSAVIALTIALEAVEAYKNTLPPHSIAFGEWTDSANMLRDMIRKADPSAQQAARRAR